MLFLFVSFFFSVLSYYFFLMMVGTMMVMVPVMMVMMMMVLVMMMIMIMIDVLGRGHHHYHHDDRDHHRCSWQTCAKKSEGLLSMLNSLSDPLTLLGKTPSMCYRSGLWHRVGSHRTFSLVSSCRLLYYASYYLGCLRLSSQAHLISRVSCRSSHWAVVLLSLCRLAI